MRGLILLILCIIAASCERRELTYDYSPTVAVQVNVDWSNLSEVPTGMSLYCYPYDGGAPTVTIANINTVNASVTVNLMAGSYKLLVFNQITSDYGTISFSGMSSFETAEINAVGSTSTWEVLKTSSFFARDPEELAAATYLNLVVTQDVVDQSIALKSKGSTKADDLVCETIDLTPKLLIKTTRVRLRISQHYNYCSARATLYGMASGYSFSEQKSHSTMTTHLMESSSWALYSYDGYSEGELSSYFTCFGLPEQSTTTRAADYSDWDGEFYIEILLADNEKIMSQTIPLYDKITYSSDIDTDIDTDIDANIDTNLDVNVDISIDYGFGEDGDDTSDDSPFVLDDVDIVDGTSSGFDATVDDWGDEVVLDLAI